MATDLKNLFKFIEDKEGKPVPINILTKEELLNSAIHMEAVDKIRKVGYDTMMTDISIALCEEDWAHITSEAKSYLKSYSSYSVKDKFIAEHVTALANINNLTSTDSRYNDENNGPEELSKWIREGRVYRWPKYLELSKDIEIAKYSDQQYNFKTSLKPAGLAASVDPTYMYHTYIKRHTQDAGQIIYAIWAAEYLVARLVQASLRITSLMAVNFMSDRVTTPIASVFDKHGIYEDSLISLDSPKSARTLLQIAFPNREDIRSKEFVEWIYQKCLKTE